MGSVNPQGRRLLLTVGVEEPGFSSSSLKLWDVDKISLAKQAQQQPTQQPQQPKSSGWTGGSVTVSGPVGSNAVGTLPSGPPQPFKSVKLFSAKYPESDVTAVAAKESVTGAGGSSSSSSGAVGGPVVTVAVGLGSGFVYLLSADLSGRESQQVIGPKSETPCDFVRFSGFPGQLDLHEEVRGSWCSVGYRAVHQPMNRVVAVTRTPAP